MAGRTFTTRGLVIGAAAVAVVLAGTRFINWPEQTSPTYRPQESDETQLPQPQVCWRGQISVTGSIGAMEEDDCSRTAQKWHGIATVLLREERHVSYPYDTSGKELGEEIVADLRVESMSWYVSASGFERTCPWGGGGARRVVFKPLETSGSTQFGRDDRGRPEGDVLGRIYYELPEGSPTWKHDDARPGEYRFSRLPNVCHYNDGGFLAPRHVIAPDARFSSSDEWGPSCRFDTPFAQGYTPATLTNAVVNIGRTGVGICPNDRLFRDGDWSGTGRNGKMVGDIDCPILTDPGQDLASAVGQVVVGWDLATDLCTGELLEPKRR